MQPIKIAPLPKEVVRQFMAKRQQEKAPPQDLNEIRRQLGLELIEAERAGTAR